MQRMKTEAQTKAALHEPPDASADAVAAAPATALDAVLAHSTPEAGQIVLGVLTAPPGPQGLGRAHVPALGELTLAGSLLPLREADRGQRVALSLLAGGQALLLGRLWDGSQAPLAELHIDERPAEHLLLQAEQRLELRCGEAAIVLHADGRIQLRGRYITSHASATQRIVGGAVHVN